MNLQAKADIYVPDGSPLEEALERTTHLCIAAHQDDAEIMAFHGIAECHEKPDNWFTAIIATDGAGSPRSGPYTNCSNEEMRETRKSEQRHAAEIGQYGLLIQLGYPSTKVKDPAFSEATGDLASILQHCRPDVVYLHNPADKHDTHVALAIRSINALRTLKPEHRPKQVLGCEVWRNLDWLPDKFKIALRADQNDILARQLIRVFQSQIVGGKRYEQAALGRRMANATFSEPHLPDQAQALTWAMDLSPLTAEPSLSVADFVTKHIDAFRSDVLKHLGTFDAK
ncbi:MAG: PIG-L family deacetylase [Methylacidiphilales bacterium]|nr:PIG-L family deacetylase [Candidatus Methylacidiphilales bacterium]